MPYLTVPGHNGGRMRELHYTDINPKDPDSDSSASARTIIFVHGLGSTQNYFFPILPYLKEYRCILFDNYGAGRSKLHQSEENHPEVRGGGEGKGAGEGGVVHSIESMAQDVLGVLDASGVGVGDADEGSGVVVVGYSMGGMVPSVLAALDTSKSGSGGGGGGGGAEGGKKGRRVRAGVCIGPVHPSGAVAEVFRKRIDAVRKGGMEVMANTIPDAATGSKATPVHKAFIREMLLGQEVEGYVANCRAIEHASPPNYQDVHIPLLIIAGDEDKSAPLKGCEYILDQVASKEKRLEVLKGVGHWHCVEAGEEVGRLVRGFVDGLGK